MWTSDLLDRKPTGHHKRKDQYKRIQKNNARLPKNAIKALPRVSGLISWSFLTADCGESYSDGRFLSDYEVTRWVRQVEFLLDMLMISNFASHTFGKHVHHGIFFCEISRDGKCAMCASWTKIEETRWIRSFIESWAMETENCSLTTFGVYHSFWNSLSSKVSKMLDQMDVLQEQWTWTNFFQSSDNAMVIRDLVLTCM